eukprot:scaffold37833_cov158-Skeletonema_marinoi.AAC.1
MMYNMILFPRFAEIERLDVKVKGFFDEYRYDYLLHDTDLLLFKKQQQPTTTTRSKIKSIGTAIHYLTLQPAEL